MNRKAKPDDGGNARRGGPSHVGGRERFERVPRPVTPGVPEFPVGFDFTKGVGHPTELKPAKNFPLPLKQTTQFVEEGGQQPFPGGRLDPKAIVKAPRRNAVGIGQERRKRPGGADENLRRIRSANCEGRPPGPGVPMDRRVLRRPWRPRCPLPPPPPARCWRVCPLLPFESIDSPGCSGR